jgi:hypothetical protein
MSWQIKSALGNIAVVQTRVTVDDVVEMARPLSPLEKLRVIERLAPDLEASLSPQAPDADALDEQYQRGYEQIAESTADVEALLPHLPIPQERWE